MAKNEQYSTVSKQNQQWQLNNNSKCATMKKKIQLREENKAQNQLNEITILLP
jgi:hypothetical protein